MGIAISIIIIIFVGLACVGWIFRGRKADIGAAIKRASSGVRCPACHCKLFYQGPGGGSALNVKCYRCGRYWWYGGMGQGDFKPMGESNDEYFNLSRPMKIEDM